jgi:hypothetical protein
MARGFRVGRARRTLGAVLFLLLLAGLAAMVVIQRSTASDRHGLQQQARQLRADLRQQGAQLDTTRAKLRRTLRQLDETQRDLRWAQAEARGNLLVAQVKDPEGDPVDRFGLDIKAMTARYDDSAGRLRLTINFYEPTSNQDVATTSGEAMVGSRDGHSNPLLIGVNVGNYEPAIDWEGCLCLTYADTYTLRTRENKEVRGPVLIRWNADRTQMTAELQNPLIKHQSFVQAIAAYYWESQHMPTEEWLNDKTTRADFRPIR